MSEDVAAYWNGSPTKRAPAHREAMPRVVDRPPVGADDRQPDPRILVPESGGPHHGADVEHLAVLEARQPIGHANRAAKDALHARRRRARPCGSARAARRAAGGPAATLRPIGVRTVRTWWTNGQNSAVDGAGDAAVDVERHLAGVAAGEPGLVPGRCGVVRDLRPRVARADDQHRTGCQLRRIAVLRSRGTA